MFDRQIDDALCIDFDRENEVLAEMDFDDALLFEQDVYDADPTGGQPSRY